MLVTTERGITIRMAVKGIRSQARNTLGVRVIRLDEGDTVRDAVILEPPIETADAEGSAAKPVGPGPGPEPPEPPAEEETVEDDEEGDDSDDRAPADDDSDDDTEDEDAPPAETG